MNKKWWHNSVVYQIYPRSFKDSNGDGIGDLNGIIEKLPYIAMLGVDVIWLSPVFKSPNDDNGYDISDYRDIMDEFGNMADMDKLLVVAKENGIKILMDLVANHTSDEHEWFKESRKSRENPYRDYYIWRDEPNALTSFFLGSAWELDAETEQYYLHFFTKRQPDLNWENPCVRQEVWDLMNFWIDKGIGGFRIDVIELFGKEPDKLIGSNGPKLHDYIREMNKNTFGSKDLLTVGECWSADISDVKKYSNADGSELSMAFQFEHACLDIVAGGEKWDIVPFPIAKLKECLVKWQVALKDEGWNTLFWNNHDLPRSVSRFGDDGEYRVQSAKMLATILYGLKGTPYIYQGEELGMTNIAFESIEDYRDVETLNMYKQKSAAGYSERDIFKALHVKSRDNARTPMQWSAEKNAGFTCGEPWIPVNPNYTEINAENQINDPDSIFNYYKKLIELRKSMEVFIYGEFEERPCDNENIFVYTRTLGDVQILVVANLTGKQADFELEHEFDTAETLIENYMKPEKAEKLLRPYEARIYAR